MEQRIEECVGELYAIQKQAGDRMVRLTEENKAILQKMETEVSRHIKEMAYYEKLFIFLITFIAITSMGLMFWSCYNFNEKFNNRMEKMAELVDVIIYSTSNIYKELEKLEKQNYKPVKQTDDSVASGKKR